MQIVVSCGEYQGLADVREDLLQSSATAVLLRPARKHIHFDPTPPQLSAVPLLRSPQGFSDVSVVRISPKLT
jgi:hypothetical protein